MGFRPPNLSLLCSSDSLLQLSSILTPRALAASFCAESCCRLWVPTPPAFSLLCPTAVVGSLVSCLHPDGLSSGKDVDIPILFGSSFTPRRTPTPPAPAPHQQPSASTREASPPHSRTSSVLSDRAVPPTPPDPPQPYFLCSIRPRGCTHPIPTAVVLTLSRRDIFFLLIFDSFIDSNQRRTSESL